MADEISELNNSCLTGAACARSVGEKKLVASRCRKCGQLHFPARPICPACRGREMDTVGLSGRGRLVALTVLSVGTPFLTEEGFSREKPSAACIVELEEGVRATGRLSGCDTSRPETIKPGTPVEADFVEYSHGGARRVFLVFRLQRQ